METPTSTGTVTQPAPLKPWRQVAEESNIFSLPPEQRIAEYDKWSAENVAQGIKDGDFDSPDTFNQFKLKDIRTRKNLASDDIIGPSDEEVFADYEAFKGAFASTQAAFSANKPTPEDEAIQGEVLQGKRKSAFLRGQMFFNPAVVNDPQKYREAILESDAPSDIKMFYAGLRPEMEKSATVTRRRELANNVITRDVADRVVTAIQEGTELFGADIGTPQSPALKKNKDGIWSVVDPEYVDQSASMLDIANARYNPLGDSQYKPLAAINEYQKKYGLTDEQVQQDYMESLIENAPTSVNRWFGKATSIEDYVKQLDSTVRVKNKDVAPEVRVQDPNLFFDPEGYNAAVDKAKAPDEAKNLAKEARTQFADAVAGDIYNNLLNNRDDFRENYAKNVVDRKDMEKAITRYYKDKKDQAWYDDVGEAFGQAGTALTQGGMNLIMMPSAIKGMFGSVEDAEDVRLATMVQAGEMQAEEAVANRTGGAGFIKLNNDVMRIIPDLAVQMGLAVGTGWTLSGTQAAILSARTGIGKAAAKAAIQQAAITGEKAALKSQLLKIIPDLAGSAVDDVAEEALKMSARAMSNNPLKGGVGTQRAIGSAYAGLTSASSTFGQVYTDVRKMGKSPEEAIGTARTAAVVAGAITSGLTHSFGMLGRGGVEDFASMGRKAGEFTIKDIVNAGLADSLSTPEGRQLIRNIAKGFGRDALSEGAEEGLDQALNLISQYATNPSPEAQNRKATDIINESLYASLLGGIAGGGAASVGQARASAPGVTAQQMQAEIIGAQEPAAPVVAPPIPAAPATPVVQPSVDPVVQEAKDTVESLAEIPDTSQTAAALAALANAAAIPKPEFDLPEIETAKPALEPEAQPAEESVVQPKPATPEPVPAPPAPKAPIPVAPAVVQPAKPVEAKSKPVETAAPAQDKTKLPKELAGAKPRYGYGTINTELSFASDFDKAAYIVAQEKKNRRHDDYMKWAVQSSGLTEEQVRAHGTIVRESIKASIKPYAQNKRPVPALFPVAATPVNLSAQAVKPVAKPEQRTPFQAVISKPITESLPRELAGAKPRYAFKDKNFTISFISDFDKAAYIVSQSEDKKNKQHAGYLAWAVKVSGLTADQVQAHGSYVRQSIKTIAQSAEGGTPKTPKPITIGRQYVKGEPAPVNAEETLIEPTSEPAKVEPEPTENMKTARDTTKPEQMTPEEYHSYNAEGIIADYESGGKVERGFASYETVKPMSEAEKADIRSDKEFSARNQRSSIDRAVEDKAAVSAAAVDAYGITLPSGYVKQGELYVYQPEQKAEAAVEEVPASTEATVAETPAKPRPDVAAVRAKIKEAASTYDKVKLIEGMISSGEFIPAVIEAAETGDPLPVTPKDVSIPSGVDIPKTVSIDRIKVPAIKPTTPEKAVENAVSKDETRFILNGVFLDAESQKAVASDGRMIIVAPAKVTGESRIIAVKDIKKTDFNPEVKKGGEIPGSFPNWRQVTPKPTSKSKAVNTDEILRASVVLLGVNKAMPAKGSVSALLQFGGAYFNPEYIKKAVTGILQSGAKSITYQLDSEIDPILLTGDNGAFAVVMPVRLPNDAKIISYKPGQPKPTKQDAVQEPSPDASVLRQEGQEAGLPEVDQGGRGAEQKAAGQEGEVKAELTDIEKKALALTKLKGAEPRADGMTFIPDKLMTSARRASLRNERETRYESDPRGGPMIEIKRFGEVIGDPTQGGWLIIDRRITNAARKAAYERITEADKKAEAKPELTPEQNDVVVFVDIENDTQEKAVVAAEKKPRMTPGKARKVGIAKQVDRLGITSNDPDSVIAALEKIAAKPPQKHHGRIAKDLLSVLKDSGVKIQLVSGNDARMAKHDSRVNGWYDPKTNTAYINLDGLHELGIEETILHELVHASGEKVIQNPQTDAQKRILADLEKQMLAARKNAIALGQAKLGTDVTELGLLTEMAAAQNDYGLFDILYGVSSLSEYHAHATTSRSFQKFLAAYKEGGKRSLMERFINSITSLLSGKKTADGSDAEKAYATLLDLMREGKGDVRLSNADVVQSRARGASTEQDAEYLELAKDEEKNADALQAIVDAAAKAAGGQLVFHGGDIEGDVIDVNRRERGAESERRAGTFYASSNPDAAKTYPGKQQRLFFFLRNPFRIGTPEMRPASWTGDTAVRAGGKVISKKTSLSIGEAVDRAKQFGYDGVIYDNIVDTGRLPSQSGKPPIGSTYVAFNSEQIKSADPVTRDNAGNIIPPSQRFQSTSPDIRFSRARGRFDLVDAVRAASSGDASTPFEALNESINARTELTRRIQAGSERRNRAYARGKRAILVQIITAGNTGRLPEEAIQPMVDFVNSVSPKALADTRISLSVKPENSIFEFADALVTLALNGMGSEPGEIDRTAIHEFWHGLSRFIPDDEIEKIRKDYVVAVKEYISENPWFVPFIGRTHLSEAQYDDLSRMLSKEEMDAIPWKKWETLEDGRRIRGLKWTKENYRLFRLDEWVAETMADLVRRKQERPTTFLGKMARLFRDFIDTLKQALGNPYLKALDAMTVPEEAFDAQIERFGPIEDNPPVMYGGEGVGMNNQFTLGMYAGEQSLANMPEETRAFKRDSLEAARAMAAAGKTSEEIRAVTGWFPGKYDGKMRWEIPDAEATLRLAEYRKERKDDKSAKEIVREFFVEKQRREYEDATKVIATLKGRDIINYSRAFEAKKKDESTNLYEFYAGSENQEKNRVPLSYLLDHPVLFDAYPELRWMPISFNATDLGANINTVGSYNPSLNVIALNPIYAFEDETKALSTLLHETQHAIQKIEGFAKGGNTSVAAKEIAVNSDAYKYAKADANAAEAKYRKIKAERVSQIVKERGSPGALDDLLADTYPEVDEARKKASRLRVGADYVTRTLEAGKVSPEDAFKKYQEIAGEIEARDIQARRSFTAEQRAATEPYSSENVAPEDAIVIFSRARSIVSDAVTNLAPEFNVVDDKDGPAVFFDGRNVTVNPDALENLDEYEVKDLSERAVVAAKAAPKDPIAASIIQQTDGYSAYNFDSATRKEIRKSLAKAHAVATENGMAPLAMDLGTKLFEYGGATDAEVRKSMARGVPSDEEYLAAVEAGDMEKAQQMVNAAAIIVSASEARMALRPSEKDGGVDPRTNETWIRDNKTYVLEKILLNEIESNFEGDRYDRTTDIQTAKKYAERRGEFPPIIISRSKVDGKWAVNDGGHRVSAARIRGDKFIDTIREFKSIDPVTYGDAGNVIPLSERFPGAAMPQSRARGTEGVAYVPTKRSGPRLAVTKFFAGFRSRGMVTEDTYEIFRNSDAYKREIASFISFIGKDFSNVANKHFGEGEENWLSYRIFSRDATGEVAVSKTGFKTAKEAESFATLNRIKDYTVATGEDLMNRALGSNGPTLSENVREKIEQLTKKGLDDIAKSIAAYKEEYLDYWNLVMLETQADMVDAKQIATLRERKQQWMKALQLRAAEQRQIVDDARKEAVRVALEEGTNRIIAQQQFAKSYLPDDLVHQIERSRAKIDELSGRLTKIEWLMDGSQLQMIIDAKTGVYVTRSYEAFETNDRVGYVNWLDEAYRALYDPKQDYDPLAKERIMPLVRHLKNNIIERRIEDLKLENEQRQVDEIMADLMTDPRQVTQVEMVPGQSTEGTEYEELVRAVAKRVLLRRRSEEKKDFIRRAMRSLALNGFASNIGNARKRATALRKEANRLYDQRYPEQVAVAGIMGAPNALRYTLMTDDEAHDIANMERAISEMPGSVNGSEIWTASISGKKHPSFYAAVNDDFRQNLDFITGAPSSKTGFSGATANDWKRLGDKILEHKNDVPAFLRTFLGERDNPLLRVSDTLLKQSHLIAVGELYQNLAKTGMAQGWIVDRGTLSLDGKKYAGWKTILDSEKTNQGYENNPFSGKYIDPVMADAINVMLAANEPSNTAFKAVAKFVGFALWGVTAGSVKAIVRNLFSAPSFLLNSGFLATILDPRRLRSTAQNVALASIVMQESMSSVAKVSGGKKIDNTVLKGLDWAWTGLLTIAASQRTATGVMKGVGTVGEFISQMKSKPTSEAAQQFYSLAVRLGVANDNVQKEAMERLLSLEETISRQPKDKNLGRFAKALKLDGVVGFGSYLLGTIKSAGQQRSQLYGAPDDFTKILAWLNEMDSQARIHAKDTAQYKEWKGADGLFTNMPENLVKLAADHTTDTIQSHSKVWAHITQFKKLGFGVLLAPFVAARAEFYRNAINAYRIGFQELRSENGKERSYGAARIASAVLAHTAYANMAGAALSMIFRAMADDDDVAEDSPEKREAIRKLGPEYAKNKNATYVVYKNGTFDWLDISFSDPFSFVSSSLNAARRGIDEKAVDDHVAWSVAKELMAENFGTFVSPQIAVGATATMISGYDPVRGIKIWDSQADTTAEKVQKAITYYMKQAGTPGDIKSAMNIIKAARGIEENGRQYKLGTEVGGVFLGASVRTIKVTDMVEQKLAQAKDNLNTRVGALYEAQLRDSNDVDMDDVVAATETYHRVGQDAIRRMQKVWKAGETLLSDTPGGRKMLRDTLDSDKVKMSKEVERAIVTGKQVPSAVSDQTMQKIETLAKKHDDDRAKVTKDTLKRLNQKP